MATRSQSKAAFLGAGPSVDKPGDDDPVQALLPMTLGRGKAGQ